MNLAVPRVAIGIGRPSARTIAAFLAIAVWLVLPASTAAAEPASFGTPSASSAFGKGVDFVQPVTVAGSVRRVEILLSTPGAIGPTVQSLPDRPGAGDSSLRYHLDLSDGNTSPNTTYTARWRLTATDGTTSLGPPLVHVYADDRFRWKTLAGTVVRVHWVEGDASFGRRALKIGDDAVAATSKLLGVSEAAPIDFFIYADQSAFYDALGPATRENVGGQAHPDIRTLFALITPGDINAGWVETVVPHELTHVVFQSAVDNPYHDPPHWLNEGLAVYLSAGYGSSDRSQVEAASKDGAIIPLDGLDGAFPTTRDRFFLAYAESVSAVDRIVRANGRDALVRLIRSYRAGVSDDDAFQAALGRTVAGFQADWLAELGATAPPKSGPRPAPAGPLPPGWTGPQPNPSFEVTGPVPAPGAPRPGRPADDPLARFLIPSFSVLGLVVLLVVGILGTRRMAGRRPAGDPDGSWNRLYGRPRDDVSLEPPTEAPTPDSKPANDDAIADPEGDNAPATAGEADRPASDGPAEETDDRPPRPSLRWDDEP